MLQPPDSQKSQLPSNPSFSPSKTVSVPVEQATIGRSVVIKGEVSGTESLYVDGRIEGTVNFAEHRVTIGRNGSVAANITAREVVILGKVQGNIQCTDRLDIRSEGSLTGRCDHPAHQRGGWSRAERQRAGARGRAQTGQVSAAEAAAS